MLCGFADQEHERLRLVHSFAQFSLYVVFAPCPIGHVVQVVSVEKLEINPLVRAPPSHKAVGPNILVAIKCYVRRHGPLAREPLALLFIEIEFRGGGFGLARVRRLHGPEVRATNGASRLSCGRQACGGASASTILYRALYRLSL